MKSNYIRTLEFRKIISEKRKGINNPMFGNSAWNKGLTMDNPIVSKSIKRLSECNKGRSPWNKGKKGIQEGWNKTKQN